MASTQRTLNTMSSILRLLKESLPQGTKDKSYQYLVSQYRGFQITSEKVCRDPSAATHQARTLLCYLESNKKYQELIITYKGTGERSLENSANSVGLKLPKCPEET